MKSARPACLLVLGMHRSGTSALTRILSLAGAGLPERLLPPNDRGNPTGYWEPERLVACHDRWLARFGNAWHDWRPVVIPEDLRDGFKDELKQIISEEYRDQHLFVLKDPRICKLVPVYAQVLEELGIDLLPVLIVRHPLEIAQSLKKRDGIDESISIVLTIHHLLEAERHTRSMDRVFIRHEDLYNDWPAILQRVRQTFSLEDVMAAPHEIESEVAGFLDRSMRHHHADDAEAARDPLFRGFGERLWTALHMFMDQPHNRRAMKRMDEIHEYFTSMTFIIQRMTAALLHESEKLHMQHINMLKTRFNIRDA